MPIDELKELIEIEGLEYTLRFKTDEWKHCGDKKLVKAIEDFCKAATKIEKILAQYD